MLKKILLAFALVIPFIGSAQTIKIGVINTQEVFQALPDTKTAEAKIAQVSKSYEDQFATLQTELRTKSEELEKLGPNEPQSIRERKTKDLEDLYARIQSFQETARNAIQREQQTLIAPIRQKVIDAIESVAKEGNFTIVQEKDDLLFFASPAVDITPLVRKKLGI